MADPNNNNVYDPNYSLYYESAYFPRTPQSHTAQEKARLGADNLDTRVGKRIYNKQVLGQSSDTPLGDTTFNVNLMEGVVESRRQSGQSGFTSLEERPFALSPTLTTGAPLPDGKTQLEYLDQNPAKLIEQDAGDVNEYVHQQMALSKDSPVYYNIMVPMKGPDQSKITDGRPTKEEKKAAVEGEVTWGFRPPTIEIDTEKLKRIKKAHSIPYARVIEDRVGTASYGYGEGMEGAFSEDVVMIEILQNISGLRISGSRQEFTPVEPRGSQRPMYFYNKNTGRTLEFNASFHQQEYPLEPLYSIAEKAQYLLRPYKHGDYGLIPKTVRVEVPGRVFRCYCTGAEATFEGEDYRGWSELGLNESNIGSMGYGTIYTGIRPRVEEQTGRVYNSAQYTNASVDVLTNSLYTNNDYRYGLSSMTISFQFNILEEIKLTTYETQAEIVLREEQEKEDRKKNAREDALRKAQQYIDEAKKNGVEIGYTAEQLVLVNDDGEVITLLINEDGTILPHEPSMSSATGEMTIEEYNKKKSLERANSMNTEVEEIADQMAPPINDRSTVVRQATRDDMLDAIVKDRKEQFPDKSDAELKKEVEEEFKDKSDEEVYTTYREVNYKSLSGSEEVAKFLHNSTILELEKNTSTGKVEVREKAAIPSTLSRIFKNKLNTSKDLFDFCGKDELRAEGGAEYDICMMLKCALPVAREDEDEIYGFYKGYQKYFNNEVWALVKKYAREDMEKLHFHFAVNDFESCYIDLDELVGEEKINEAQKEKLVKNLENIGEDSKEGGHQVLTMNAIAKNPINTEKDIFFIFVGLNNQTIDETVLKVVGGILKEFQKNLVSSINKFIDDGFEDVKKYALSYTNTFFADDNVKELRKVLQNRDLLLYSNVVPDSYSEAKHSMEVKRDSDKKNLHTIPGAAEWSSAFSQGVYDNFEHIYGYYWLD